MNPHILSGIKKRDQLLSRFRRNKNDKALYDEYCKTRNRVQRDIKLAKASHFHEKVVQSQGDSGKLWGLLKSLGYSKTSNSGSKIILEKDGSKVFDSLKVADIFNEFYSSVASKLVNLLPNGSGMFSAMSETFRGFYRSKLGLRDPFILMPVSRRFIRAQLLSLNPKKAVGLDGVPSLFLRDGAESIIEPICHIILLFLRRLYLQVSNKHC